MDQACQQYRNQSNNPKKILGNKELLSYRRINSPGLPNSSLRSSCKGDKKKLEIGLITDRKLSESPNLDRKFSTGNFNFKCKKQKNSVIEIPQPQSHPPKMEPKVKRNLRMIEKLESDKICLKIYMSEEDSNQIIFTGISKEKLLSPNQNKKALIQNLQQLFQNGIKNKYMECESQKKHINLEDQQQLEHSQNNHRNSRKRIITRTNESKSNLDKSLSISSIQEYKSNTSNKINKDLEKDINRQRNQEQSQTNSKFSKPQPFGQQNLTINHKQKQKCSKISSQNKKGTSPSFSQQRNSQQKCIEKRISNTKSLHV